MVTTVRCLHGAVSAAPSRRIRESIHYRRMTIRRREWLASFALGMQGARDRPNLLFLLTDDQRWDTLGCMGNRIIRTPHVDRLSEKGVTFEKHFVTTSICMTSRASIFTGQYARVHGITDFSKPFSDEQFGRTYPGILHRAGYWTGFIGKYGVGTTMHSSSFDYWRGFPGQGQYFPQGEGGRHLTEIMGDQGIEFLRGAPRDKPFCLSISFKAPHVQDEDPRQFLPSKATADLYSGVTIPMPRTADPKYVEALPLEIQRSENRRRWAVRFSTPELYQQSVKAYYRLISEVDTVVGRLRSELDRLQAAQNTVIVFTGDNGFYLGEHGLAGKWFMHEESIRVPLIVYDPRLPAPRQGAREGRMTLNIDLAPTLLAAAKVPAPVSMQGRSLYPLCDGTADSWRKEWFYEHLFDHAWIPKSEGVRSERWKYARYLETKPVFEELYDLQGDPLEQRNLAREPASAEHLDRMRARREAWLQAFRTWKGDKPWQDPA